MNLSQYENVFTEYVENISITSSQEKRIESALVNISEIMLSEFDDAEIYAQGSYALDLVVKPLTKHEGRGKAGEFDIDIAVERPSWDDAVKALEGIEAVLRDHGVYGSMEIDASKNSCVRIVYANDESTGVGFHVDIVPVKKEGEQRKIAQRNSNNWGLSDSKQFIDWFLEKVREIPDLRPLVIVLKRLRDLADLTDNFKSIAAVVLVVSHYNSYGDLLSNFVFITKSISDSFRDFNGELEILNPVNSKENLAKKLINLDAVCSFFLNLESKFEKMIAENDPQQLLEIFGNAFPIDKSEKCITISEATRDRGEQFLSDFGIGENLRYSIKLNARVIQDGWRPFFLRDTSNPLRKQRQLEFFIESNDTPTPFDVKWKVKNTGQEALDADDLRGEITDDVGRYMKKEHTKYHGAHYAECYVIKEDKCVAKDKISVPIGQF